MIAGTLYPDRAGTIPTERAVVCAHGRMIELPLPLPIRGGIVVGQHYHFFDERYEGTRWNALSGMGGKVGLGADGEAELVNSLGSIEVQPTETTRQPMLFPSGGRRRLLSSSGWVWGNATGLTDKDVVYGYLNDERPDQPVRWNSGA